VFWFGPPLVGFFGRNLHHRHTYRDYSALRQSRLSPGNLETRSECIKHRPGNSSSFPVCMASTCPSAGRPPFRWIFCCTILPFGRKIVIGLVSARFLSSFRFSSPFPLSVTSVGKLRFPETAWVPISYSKPRTQNVLPY